ncbi:hypothetical protein [Calothrix sp. 336/3]|uniref:hypothetical protein n=1 Tax=Calothrix sp. 336/3 TaxID=1337936 RepID=UPI0004E410B4|nr:hypothetical protein [Calothrix sp. 336/3]AKG23741.1 hypothetical protein IJ00_22785 [Calothrix sp. 336/3]
MTTNSLITNPVNQYIRTSHTTEWNVHLTQESIYNFLLELVQKCSPEDVLREFRKIFLDCLDSAIADSVPGIYEFFIKTNEQDFRNTLKRCCYILVNNWESNRKYKYIQELVDLFDNYKPIRKNHKFIRINTLKFWLENFINSRDFQELKLCAYRHEDSLKVHWVNRYSSYLLVAQAIDKNNPKEQQEVARKISKQLKDKFKFELAMYIARSQSHTSHKNRYHNPSILGDDVLRLIKAIVVKKGAFSYENIANIFLRQTQNQKIADFKDSLLKYLIFSVQQPVFVDTLRSQLAEKLLTWNPGYDGESLNKDLLLRTCNRVVDYLTTENGKEPAPLFILLLSQGHPLTLVIVLLKIILISPNSRSHLESRIAYLMRYYEKYPEEECQWVINFIEIFSITFAIYAENVEYNLIKMPNTPANISPLPMNLDSFRVFSQMKS